MHLSHRGHGNVSLIPSCTGKGQEIFVNPSSAFSAFDFLKFVRNFVLGQSLITFHCWGSLWSFGVHRTQIGSNPVAALAWHPMLQLLLTLSKEGAVQVWRPRVFLNPNRPHLRANFFEPAGESRQLTNRSSAVVDGARSPLKF